MRIGLDLDGTIISCMQKQSSLMQALSYSHGIKLNVNDFWLHKREGESNLQALASCSVSDSDAMLLNMQWIEEIENVQWMDMDTVLSGSIMFLEKQKRTKNTLHLISARNNKTNSFRQLEKLNLASYFDSIDFVSGRLGESKSNVFIKNKIELYVGDTEQDLIQAEKARIPCFLVESGMRSKSFFDKINISSVEKINKVVI